MPKKPSISIIIPIRNERKRLDYCLPSLLAQTKKDFDIILVEDPATNDGTREYVESFHDARITYHVHEPGLKVPAKRNIGASLATGKYLYFPDADMEFPENFLEDIWIEIQDAKPQLVFVSERTPGSDWLSKMKDLEKQIINNEPSLCAARLYRADIFKKFGGYNPSLIVGEEVDLSDRVVDSGVKYIVSQATVSHYETSGANLRQHFQKKLKYGMTTGSYFAAKKPVEKSAKKRAGVSRLIYFTSSKVWQNPFQGLQFILFKSSEMGCYFLGLVYASLTQKQVTTTK